MKGKFCCLFTYIKNAEPGENRIYLKNRFNCVVSNEIYDHITSRWSFYFSILSCIFIVFASVLTGVSLLHTFHEYSLQQEEENLKNEYIGFHNDLGTKLLYAEKSEAASNEFNQVLKIDPSNIKATTGLLECDLLNASQDGNSDPEIMKMQLDSLSEKYPNDPMPSLIMGELALTRGYYSDALNYYNTSLKINSDVTAAYIEKGFIFDLQGNVDDSIRMSQQAVNISYWDLTARNNLGYGYYERKDYQDAINSYIACKDIDPYFLLPYYFLSNSYRMVEDLDNAVFYQNILINCIENTNATSKRINQGTWSFYIGSGNRVFLYTMPQKEYYAYYDIALTYYLLGNKNQAKVYVNQAEDLNLDKNLQVAPLETLNYDIKNLQEESFKFKNRPESFITDFEPTFNTTANRG